MISNPVPRICAYPDPGAAALSARLSAAHAMLTEARRIELVDAGEYADIAHAVGSAVIAGRASLRLRTVDGVPLRSGRLAASPGWVRRQRRHEPGATWLAHGQTAGRLLLAAGLAPAGRVHCLPLLAPPVAAPLPSRAAERAAVRFGLGLRPGERLVIGTEVQTADGREPGWEHDLRVWGRTDVLVLRIRPADDGTDMFRVYSARFGWLIEPFALSSLLAACDVFVAAEHNLTACSPAVSAVDWNIPVVARATDAVSDLVLARGNGSVVTAGSMRIAHAVSDHLDGDPSPGPSNAPADPHHRDAEFARALLGIYRRVLRRTLVRGAA